MAQTQAERAREREQLAPTLTPHRAPVRRWILDAPRAVWRRLGLHRLPTLSLVGLFLILLLVFVSLFPSLLTSQNPDVQNLAIALQGPSAAHWLGTDSLGRDLYARLIYGTRYSVLIGVGAEVISIAVGMPLGMVAGLLGGKVERLIMSIVDVFLAFPSIILALLIVVMFGGSLWSVTIAIAIAGVAPMVRITHGPAIGIRSRGFVLGCIAFGGKPLWIMRKHLWPSLRAEILVLGSLGVGFNILAIAGLSFLGLSLPPPTATWGGAISDGIPYLQVHPLFSIIPGLAISLAVFGFNLFGDGLRDLLDPRTARRVGIG
jgi:ABC-type dipeptide/oligopeptide/nickel transport system permease subunit